MCSTVLSYDILIQDRDGRDISYIVDKRRELPRIPVNQMGGEMGRVLAVVLALTTLMAMASSALAEEPAKYNFASVQGNKNIQILPGGDGTGNMFFYNIEGNRITHVTLEVSHAPDGWQVAIQPPPGETQVEINGQVITVTENLYVEPSEASSEVIKDVPEDMVCIPVAQRGYALAKEAKIIVRVPAAAELGTQEEIIVSATACWLGQGGSVAFSQSRDFDFTVEVVSEVTEYQEKIQDGDGGANKWLLWIAGAAAIVLLALVTLFYLRRRRG